MRTIKGLVSIIVPCYNRAEYLGETLDSVLAQTYQQWECIVINDGSTDNSEQVAQEFCIKDDRFIYIAQENQGVIAAKNNAIKESHGEYILPLDDDDIIEPTFLEKAIAIMLDQKMKIVACRVDYFGDRQGEMSLSDDLTITTLMDTNLFVNTSLYRRSDYDRTGGYNSNMRGGFEDWDFWLSVLEEGGKAYRIPEILFHYRIHGPSRNIHACDSTTIKKLKNQLVQNHALLYYREFCRLYSMTQSRSYKLAVAYQRIAHKIYSWMRK